MRYLFLASIAGLAFTHSASVQAASASATAAQKSSRAPTVVAAKKAIREQFARWVKVYERGDTAGVANIYAPDAILLLPNEAPVRGRNRIRAMLAAGLERTDIHKYDYTVPEIVVSGHWAYRWGMASITSHRRGTSTAGKHSTTKLKFIDVWKKGTDGRWRIFRDSSVIDMPPSVIKLIRESRRGHA